MEAFIVDAVRTPIGKARGALAQVRADDLAARLLTELKERYPRMVERVDDVVWGATNQAGEDNRNVARMAALLADFPYEVPGVTVNRLCGSGLEAVIQAARTIRSGDGGCIIAGGGESMSRAPFAMARAAQAFPRGAPELVDTALGWRFLNPRMARRFEPQSMGETAENVAAKFGIRREAQDRFALASHEKAIRAIDAGCFAKELVPLQRPAGRGLPATDVAVDEGPRRDTSLRKLASLKPVFRADGGTVTAGNASPLSDGAAAVLVCSEQACRDMNVEPMARVVASAVAGLHPNFMGLGPVEATRKLEQKTGMKASAYDIVELNEAFASQTLACIRELGLEDTRVNPLGGAIALGHPIGCSGARIVTTLVHQMHRTGAKVGLATLCIGVGQGLSMALERP